MTGNADDAGRRGGSGLTTMVAPSKVRPARDRGVLTVTSGADAGRLIALPPGKMFTLGRAEDADHRFDDASLSRIHARIVRLADEHVVTDAGSTNGTYVNEVRLTGPQVLRDGDRVQLGNATFLRFAVVDEAEERSLRQVYDAAMRDALTGASNRKHLEDRLDAEIAFAIRHTTLLSVAMVDIDFFKKVNDTFGHLGGDAVLREVAAVLSRCLRAEDLLARYGGEEFVILARGIDLAGACVLGERARSTLSATPIHLQGQAITVTVSIGVASLACCGATRDKRTLLGIADGRLYAAKSGGRNRVVGG